MWLKLLLFAVIAAASFALSATVDTAQDLRNNVNGGGLTIKRGSLAGAMFSALETKLHPMLHKLTSSDDNQEAASALSIKHVMLPMRDGVKLSTFIVQKKQQDEDENAPLKKKRAAMLSRSPYGPTSDQMANVFITSNDFVAVIQDQRGTFASEGEYSMWHNDADDGFDTLQWITQQEWSNGRVYSCGVSADGIGTAAMLLSQPAQLKGQVLMWSTMDGFGTTYPGGVFRQGLIVGWMTLMAPLTRGVSLTKVLPNILKHNKLGEYWAPIQGPGHYHQADWPTVHITGWWDIFQGHQIDMFNQITSLSSKAHDHYLVVGPAGHCILGLLTDPLVDLHETKAIVNGLGLATEVFATEENGDTATSSTPFLNKMKKINVYMQRGGRHGVLLPFPKKKKKQMPFWSSFDEWPATQPRYLVLGANRQARLASSLSPPTSPESTLRQPTALGFGFDPLMPMRTEGGNNLILMMLGRGCGSMDQTRNAESRLDTLVFTLQEPLKEDLTLLGKVRAVLYLSTTGKDADVYVSVNDVYHDPLLGRDVSMQIRYGMQRLRATPAFAGGTDNAAVVKDKVYKVEVDMWFTGYVVPRGHRLRVVISSSSSPYYAVNLHAGGGNRLQVNHVHWSLEYPSHVELPAVIDSPLPVNPHF